MVLGRREALKGCTNRQSLIPPSDVSKKKINQSERRVPVKAEARNLGGKNTL